MITLKNVIISLNDLMTFRQLLIQLNHYCQDFHLSDNDDHQIIFLTRLPQEAQSPKEVSEIVTVPELVIRQHGTFESLMIQIQRVAQKVYMVSDGNYLISIKSRRSIPGCLSLESRKNEIYFFRSLLADHTLYAFFTKEIAFKIAPRLFSKDDLLVEERGLKILFEKKIKPIEYRSYTVPI